jgi:hypothetical protein
MRALKLNRVHLRKEVLCVIRDQRHAGMTVWAVRTRRPDGPAYIATGVDVPINAILAYRVTPRVCDIVGSRVNQQFQAGCVGAPLDRLDACTQSPEIAAAAIVGLWTQPDAGIRGSSAAGPIAG